MKSLSKLFTVVTSGPFKKGKDDCNLVIHEISPKAVEIVLRIVHKADLGVTWDVRIGEMWYIVQFCDMYEIHLKNIVAWFAKWVLHNKSRYTLCGSSECTKDCSAQYLLYPCFVFDQAKAFLHITRHLVYRSSWHIREGNPSGLWRFHMPHCVIRKYCYRNITVSLTDPAQNS